MPTDQHVHTMGPERRHTARSGPLEGDWLLAGCLGCNAFTLRPGDGSDGYDLVVAAVEAANARQAVGT